MDYLVYVTSSRSHPTVVQQPMRHCGGLDSWGGRQPLDLSKCVVYLHARVLWRPDADSTSKLTQMALACTGAIDGPKDCFRPA